MSRFILVLFLWSFSLAVAGPEDAFERQHQVLEGLTTVSELLNDQARLERLKLAVQDYYRNKISDAYFKSMVQMLRKYVASDSDLDKRFMEPTGGKPFRVETRVTSLGVELRREEWEEHWESWRENLKKESAHFYREKDEKKRQELFDKDVSVLKRLVSEMQAEQERKKAEFAAIEFRKQRRPKEKAFNAKVAQFYAKVLPGRPEFKRAAAYLVHERLNNEQIRDGLSSGDADVVVSTLRSMRKASSLNQTAWSDIPDELKGRFLSLVEEPKIPDLELDDEGKPLQTDFFTVKTVKARKRVVPQGRVSTGIYHFVPARVRLLTIFQPKALGECIASSASRCLANAPRDAQLHNVEKEGADEERSYLGFLRQVPGKVGDSDEIKVSLDLAAPIFGKKVVIDDPEDEEAPKKNVTFFELVLPEIIKTQPKEWTGNILGRSNSGDNAHALKNVRRTAPYVFGDLLGSGFQFVDPLVDRLVDSFESRDGYSDTLTIDATLSGNRHFLLQLDPDVPAELIRDPEALTALLYKGDYAFIDFAIEQLGNMRDLSDTHLRSILHALSFLIRGDGTLDGQGIQLLKMLNKKADNPVVAEGLKEIHSDIRSQILEQFNDSKKMRALLPPRKGLWNWFDRLREYIHRNIHEKSFAKLRNTLERYQKYYDLCEGECRERAVDPERIQVALLAHPGMTFTRAKGDILGDSEFLDTPLGKQYMNWYTASFRRVYLENEESIAHSFVLSHPDQRKLLAEMWERWNIPEKEARDKLSELFKKVNEEGGEVRLSFYSSVSDYEEAPRQYRKALREAQRNYDHSKSLREQVERLFYTNPFLLRKALPDYDPPRQMNLSYAGDFSTATLSPFDRGSGVFEFLTRLKNWELLPGDLEFAKWAIQKGREELLYSLLADSNRQAQDFGLEVMKSLPDEGIHFLKYFAPPKEETLPALRRGLEADPKWRATFRSVMKDPKTNYPHHYEMAYPWDLSRPEDLELVRHLAHVRYSDRAVNLLKDNGIFDFPTTKSLLVDRGVHAGRGDMWTYCVGELGKCTEEQRKEIIDGKFQEAGRTGFGGDRSIEHTRDLIALVPDDPRVEALLISHLPEEQFLKILQLRVKERPLTVNGMRRLADYALKDYYVENDKFRTKQARDFLEATSNKPAEYYDYVLSFVKPDMSVKEAGWVKQLLNNFVPQTPTQKGSLLDLALEDDVFLGSPASRLALELLGKATLDDEDSLERLYRDFVDNHEHTTIDRSRVLLKKHTLLPTLEARVVEDLSSEEPTRRSAAFELHTQFMDWTDGKELARLLERRATESDQKARQRIDLTYSGAVSNRWQQADVFQALKSVVLGVGDYPGNRNRELDSHSNIKESANDMVDGIRTGAAGCDRALQNLKSLSE